MASYVFPKVESPKILHSNRDLSLYKVASLSVGPLYPILAIDVLPDDWMRINTTATIESFPMIAPVMGRWKVSFDYFLEPWSNLYGFIDNNRKMSTEAVIEANRWCFEAGTDATFTNPVYKADLIERVSSLEHTSLLDYLGISPGFMGNSRITGTNFVFSKVRFPAEKLMTYWDIVRNYYVNNQEGVAYYIGRPSNPDATIYQTVGLSTLDDLFNEWRYQSNTVTSDLTLEPRNADVNDPIGAAVLQPFLTQYQRVADGLNGRKAGLALRTYRMDLLRGIMNTDVGEYKSIVSVTRQSDGGDGFDIDTLRFANKLQKFIDRIDLSRGRFSDFMRTRWNVDAGLNIDRPIYLGSHSTWLSTIDIVATAAGQSGDADSNNPDSQLGQQSGYIAGSLGHGKQRPITFKSRNYATLMCILSIVPEVVYSQGIEIENLKTRFIDIYDPAFAQLGYQDVSRFEMSVFPDLTTEGALSSDNVVAEPADIDESVGKRVAWSEYLASLNRAHGDFAYGGSLDFWVLGRQYTTPDVENPGGLPVYSANGVFDATTYIKPDLWNGVFADKDLTADNFRVAVRFEIDANRALGKRLMPHL